MNKYVLKHSNEDIILIPSLNLYENGVLALRFTSNDSKYDFIATCNFGFVGIKFSSYLDINNYPFILEFLTKYKFGEELPYTKKSGYCEYPLFLFDEKLLQLIDKNVVNIYSKSFEDNLFKSVLAI